LGPTGKSAHPAGMSWNALKSFEDTVGLTAEDLVIPSGHEQDRYEGGFYLANTHADQDLHVATGGTTATASSMKIAAGDRAFMFGRLTKTGSGFSIIGSAASTSYAVIPFG